MTAVDYCALVFAGFMIAWYVFAIGYIGPRMPKRWNRRAVWLFAVAFIPVLIPIELYLVSRK